MLFFSITSDMYVYIVGGRLLEVTTFVVLQLLEAVCVMCRY